jgi:hypothetical protein
MISMLLIYSEPYRLNFSRGHKEQKIECLTLPSNTMEEINKQELILALIRDNLINMKLISGLNALGLIADDYYLNLGDTVFKFNGFRSQ